MLMTAPTPLANVGEKDGGLIHSVSISTAPGDSHQARPTRLAPVSQRCQAACRWRFGAAAGSGGGWKGASCSAKGEAVAALPHGEAKDVPTSVQESPGTRQP
ncbi:unnamed protein product [Prorocentrum cordatum]|uniref:Uncharacterized protein n=1 Tax=Prorocentrum cordatum TaxID=2364126 RepID=A0ABN9WSP1_9DINO|nr:unnamed protein product [Polarella glacialis]